MPVPLPPEIVKLLKDALQIRESQVPLHRVIDILATESGDISEAVNRFRDIENKHLRRSLHYCALLLRALEAEAGMRPSWEGAAPSAPAKSSAAKGKEKPAKPRTQKGFPPEELKPFEDTAARGSARAAKVFVDGASSGNPGPAGIGVALFAMDGRKLGQLSKSIGEATNNTAEYTALIEALRLGQRLGIESLAVLADSELVVRQMTGVYKIKDPNLFQLAQQAQREARKLGKVTYSHIPREQNKLADALSTACLPKKESRKKPGGVAADAHDDNPDEGSTS